MTRPTADELEAMPPAEFAAFLNETGMIRPSREALAAALRELEDWKTGRRSWINLGPNPPHTPDVIAVMDAQEVVKLGAYVQALAALPPAEVVEDPSVEGLQALLDECTVRPEPFSEDFDPYVDAAALHVRLFGDTR